MLISIKDKHILASSIAKLGNFLRHSSTKSLKCQVAFKSEVFVVLL